MLWFHPYYLLRRAYYDCRKDYIFSNADGAGYNIKRFEQFLENIEEGTPDAVTTVIYSIDGDPILYHNFYDGESILSIENTTNATSGFMRRYIKKFEGDSIEEIKVSDGYRYMLMDGMEQIARLFFYKPSELFIGSPYH